MNQKQRKLNVAVIFGGKSGEHEVSLVSATAIIKNLDKSKYRIIPVGITKRGEWLTGPKILEKFKNKSRDGLQKIKIIPNNKSVLSVNGKSVGIDAAFPVLHGTFGEDGTIQGLFEMMNVPYVGAGVLGSAIGMDKVVQKKILRQEKLPVVDFVELYFCHFERSEKSHTKHEAYEIPRLPRPCVGVARDDSGVFNNILRRLKFPAFVKPANMGSSVGISKARNLKELKIGVNLAKKYGSKIIIEKAVPNVREFECSVLGNENPKASAVGEIIASNEFYDYDAKYVDGKSQTIIPAKISKKLSKKIQELAIKAYKTLNCEGMARVDFLYNSGAKKLYINELNTIPGFTQISMYPKLWMYSGLKYNKLLDELIKLAIKRHKNKNKLLISYKPSKKWYK